jgi:glycosyltransferase involved in cell wall biosynthesis
MGGEGMGRSDGRAAADRPMVSLIVPAYNEAGRLAHTLPRLRSEFTLDRGFEVIIVDDGSTDGTSELVESQLADWPGCTLLRMPWNQGKGSAIKAGVGISSGDRIAFMDADLSAELSDLPRLLAALDDADVSLGSRSIAGSRVSYGRSRSLRKLQSKFFNGVACAMANVVASDTQCGFKAFRADAAKLLFHLCEGKGFAFDVEVIALAQLLGLRIAEVPIQWVESEGTTIRPVRDPLIMIRDLVRTRRRCVRLETLMGRRVEEASAPLPAPAHWAHRIVGGTVTELLVDVTIDGSERSEISRALGTGSPARGSAAG